jgi:hypothetical protein
MEWSGRAPALPVSDAEMGRVSNGAPPCPSGETAKPTLPLFQPYPTKLWNPLSSGSHFPPPVRRANLIGLYQRVIDDLDSFGSRRRPQEVIPNGNKIRVTGTITV